MHILYKAHKPKGQREPDRGSRSLQVRQGGPYCESKNIGDTGAGI